MAKTDGNFPVEKSDAEWRAALTQEQYMVLRHAATERPGDRKSVV